MKLSGTSLHRYSNSVALTANSSASREVADGARGSQRDTACFYFRAFHSCTDLKQQTIWSHKNSTRPLYHVLVWCFLYQFGAFQLILDKKMKGCECKSRYAWQKVVCANVYDATCDFDHEREVEGCNTTTHSTYKTNNYHHLNKITQTR